MSPEPGGTQDDAQALAEITAALTRRGVTVSAAQVADMVQGYQFVRRGLDTLQHHLPAEVEPALTFDSAEPYRMPGEGDSDAGC